ncbi:MAG: hypothetical protein LBM93_06545, partial [Oscillospiraceae bacterium]|nr:hypothetical protein [Oscillospiraceae bacterium]
MFKRKIRSLVACFTAVALIVNVSIPYSVMGATEVPITEENFPDPNFRLYIEETYDTDKDKILSQTEIASATTLNAPDYGIISLEGIRHLTALTDIDISGNHITGIYDWTENSQSVPEIGGELKLDNQSYTIFVDNPGSHNEASAIVPKSLFGEKYSDGYFFITQAKFQDGTTIDNDMLVALMYLSTWEPNTQQGIALEVLVEDVFSNEELPGTIPELM